MMRYVMTAAAAGIAITWSGALHAAAAPPSTGEHIIIALTGAPAIKRFGVDARIPAALGISLGDRDLVYNVNQSTLGVLCADFQKISIIEPVANVPCKPGGKPVMKYRNQPILPPVGTYAGIELLYPQATQVQVTRPEIRWIPAGGGGKVVISLTGPDVKWSRTVADEGFFAYPADATQLSRGRSYTVIVNPAGKPEVKEMPSIRAFRVMTDAEVGTVTEAIERLKQLELPPQVQGLVRGKVYASFDLQGEAMTELQGAGAAAPTRTPALLALGDLYGAVGAPRAAEGAYIQAETAAKGVDPFAEALAAHSLARLYSSAIFKPGESRQRYGQAIAIYEKLGSDRAKIAANELLIQNTTASK